ncbi:unnamed protein product [Protopolystoma xenopodis]|uniref:Uncharacterized protein n=1 Tax=Protopolystoma xenopodis TaxID=117903 RepID=A0A448WAK4_9PLAT|nr:unnamed protein product [Protopolystoma xenopodis]
MIVCSDDIRHLTDEGLAPFTRIEEDCLREGVGTHFPVKPTDKRYRPSSSSAASPTFAPNGNKSKKK